MKASRCVAMLGISAAILVAGASGAPAKGPMVVEATITGPGLDAPIVLSDPDGPVGLNDKADSERFSLFVEQTGIYDTLYGRKSVTSREPTGRLGPRFTVMWTLAFVIGADGSTETIGEFKSNVYPYAEQGPVLFTPSTDLGVPQPVMTIDAAWSHAPPALVENLQAWGLPGRGELERAREPSDEIVATPAEVIWPWLVPIVLLLAVAAVIGLVTWRREPFSDPSGDGVVPPRYAP